MRSKPKLSSSKGSRGILSSDLALGHLVALIKAHSCHQKTDVKMLTKWEAVAGDLCTSEGMESCEAVSAHWLRSMYQALKKALVASHHRGDRAFTANEQAIIDLELKSKREKCDEEDQDLDEETLRNTAANRGTGTCELVAHLVKRKQPWDDADEDEDPDYVPKSVRKRAKRRSKPADQPQPMPCERPHNGHRNCEDDEVAASSKPSVSFSSPLSFLLQNPATSSTAQVMQRRRADMEREVALQKAQNKSKLLELELQQVEVEKLRAELELQSLTMKHRPH